MRYFPPKAWQYIKNEEGTYSVSKTDSVHGKRLVAVAFREDDARLIASVPEMETALHYAAKTLKATEAFMADKGMETDDLSEIVGVIERLLDRVNGTEE
ncbi:MAG: hypothetical protein IJG37_08355 [Synergistaceae bacterium]|nr:hypothetical protein [Synergistaceae bacterium]